MAVRTVDARSHPGSPTAGIQEAIDALPENGGMVVIPAGTYLLRGSVRLRPRVRLTGEGPATVLTRPPVVVFDVTETIESNHTTAALNSVAGLHVGDEVWIGDAKQGGWHSRHLRITSIQGLVVDGVMVAGDPKRAYLVEDSPWGANVYPAFLIHKSDDVTIESLTIDGGAPVQGLQVTPDFTCAAVHGVSSRNVRVANVTVRRWPSDGIGVQGGCGIVSGCIVEDCLGHGFHPGTSIEYGVWTNNISRGNRNGFFFCLNVRNNVVANNVFISNRLHGVDDLRAPDAFNVVVGNVASDNGLHGIEASNALGNVIAANVCRDNSRIAPGAGVGIHLTAHRDNVVTANACLDTREPHHQAKGVEATHPAGDNLIAGNLTPEYSTPQPALPAATMRRTDVAPKLDGDLGDPCWNEAEELPCSLDKDTRAQSVAPTRVRFLYDDRFLYVAAFCGEPLMERLRDRITQPGGDVWRENSIEVFLDPVGSGAVVYQLCINSLAATQGFRHEAGASNKWDPKAQTAALRGKDFWSLEMAIPLEALAVRGIKAGDAWTINVCRSRMTVRPAELTCWSPTRGAFLQPSRFGRLTAQ
jgi:parallel beta-helix repeat protein